MSTDETNGAKGANGANGANGADGADAFWVLGACPNHIHQKTYSIRQSTHSTYDIGWDDTI